MKVAVIYGGISSEREISLRSGKAIIDNLDRNKYEVIGCQMYLKLTMILILPL